MKTKKEHWLKKSYQKATLETKLLVVDQIQNGQISTNFASKKYDVSHCDSLNLKLVNSNY